MLRIDQLHLSTVEKNQNNPYVPYLKIKIYTKVASNNYCTKKSNELELEDKSGKNLGRVSCVI